MILLLPWLPLAGALALLLTRAGNTRLLKLITLAVCTVCSAIAFYHWVLFDPLKTDYQFVRRFFWIPFLGVYYQVGFDGINLTLTLLHALVSLAGAFVACQTKERLKEYLCYYLVLVAGIYGVFSSLDLFFLYLFYELTLIPLFPMIGIWGSKNRSYGAMKLTLYITAGAVLALFGLLLLYREFGFESFDLITLRQSLAAKPLPGYFQKLVAPFFLIGFGVIASLWPLHSWSPIGYAAAPTSVSMLHAGVLKKMGPYLMIRIAVDLLPKGVHFWAAPLAVLAGIGILYAGLAAIWQKDLKFMVGFSSVSHMGYVLLGIASMNPIALSGAVFLMFSHGVMAACAFACIGFLYEQTHVRGLTDFGGLSKKVPFIATSFILASLASLGLPGFSNFVSELLIFIGAWKAFAPIVVAAVAGILITAVYLLRAVQQVCYGPESHTWAELRDARGMEERFPFLLLLGALLLFGFWPQGLLQIIQPAVAGVLP
ncbi:MAG: complex I subunit 4 family protein [Candidatus Omnitrophota bacterium]